MCVCVYIYMAVNTKGHVVEGGGGVGVVVVLATILSAAAACLILCSLIDLS